MVPARHRLRLTAMIHAYGLWIDRKRRHAPKFPHALWPPRPSRRSATPVASVTGERAGIHARRDAEDAGWLGVDLLRGAGLPAQRADGCCAARHALGSEHVERQV